MADRALSHTGLDGVRVRYPAGTNDQPAASTEAVRQVVALAGALDDPAGPSMQLSPRDRLLLERIADGIDLLNSQIGELIEFGRKDV